MVSCSARSSSSVASSWSAAHLQFGQIAREAGLGGGGLGCGGGVAWGGSQLACTPVALPIAKGAIAAKERRW